MTITLPSSTWPLQSTRPASSRGSCESLASATAFCIDSSNSHHRRLHEQHNKSFPPIATSAPRSKVPVSQVIAENGGKSREPIPHQQLHFLTQLGKNFFVNPSGHPLLEQQTNKATGINFARLSGYKSCSEIYSLEEFENFLSLVPVILGKLCLHHLYRNDEEPEGEDPKPSCCSSAAPITTVSTCASVICVPRSSVY